MLHVQIICLRSLGHKVVDYELVRQSMCVFAERAASRVLPSSPSVLLIVRCAPPLGLEHSLKSSSSKG
ncbi:MULTISPECIES: hypothetical protein [unclassified Providencia]|uniref:hypothetical protein n=1 Tax=unclassified Providencia TaxID=2633465 RepID=UPI0018A7710D|nr:MULTISPECIES: hypothetical protein [unclassified Providencia]